MSIETGRGGVIVEAIAGDRFSFESSGKDQYYLGYQGIFGLNFVGTKKKAIRRLQKMYIRRIARSNSRRNNRSTDFRLRLERDPICI